MSVILCVVMLSVIMLSVVMLSVILLIVVMLSATTPIVIGLSVIVLNGACYGTNRYITKQQSQYFQTFNQNYKIKNGRAYQRNQNIRKRSVTQMILTFWVVIRKKS
jgi:hypothetical protein